jgi:hypothetical protein
MEYLYRKSFSVGGYGKKFSSNWDKIFGKKKLKGEIAELEKDILCAGIDVNEVTALGKKLSEKRMELAKLEADELEENKPEAGP